MEGVQPAVGTVQIITLGVLVEADQSVFRKAVGGLPGFVKSPILLNCCPAIDRIVRVCGQNAS